MSGTTNGRSPRSVALVGPYGSGKSTLFDALMDAAGSPVKRPADPRNRPTHHRAPPRPLHLSGRPLDHPRLSRLDRIRARSLLPRWRWWISPCVVCEPQPATRARGRAAAEARWPTIGVPHMCSSTRSTRWRAACATRSPPCRRYANSPLVLRQVPIVEAAERHRLCRCGQRTRVSLPQGPAVGTDADPLRDGGRGTGSHSTSWSRSLADHDDVLLEKVLEDIKPTTAEIYADLRKDLAAGAVIEVLLGAADNADGVRRLWKALRHDTPDVAETAERKGIATDGPPLVAGVQDRARRPHRQAVLRPHLARCDQGRGHARRQRGSAASTTCVGGELTKVHGGRDRQIWWRSAGWSGAPTGATVSPAGTPEPLPFPDPPPPVYSLAIATTDRKDDVKLSGALQKLLEEDQTLAIEHEPGHRRDGAARPGRDSPEHHGASGWRGTTA